MLSSLPAAIITHAVLITHCSQLAFRKPENRCGMAECAFLDATAFLPLRDESVFRDVYIDCGVAVWMDGDIGLAPTYLYEHAAPCEASIA